LTPTIEHVYFEWLTGHINFNHGRPNGKTYVDLMGLLHNKEFIWIVANDDNRLEDAEALRHEFISDEGITRPGGLLDHQPPLSVLEIIVSLSVRCAFADGGNAQDWAWTLIKNLDLHRMSDPLSRMDVEEVDDILDTLIYRNYDPDGSGGFFPLNHPQVNQKEVELWYQMNAYIDELLEN
jgi:hypothetical protein